MIRDIRIGMLSVTMKAQVQLIHVTVVLVKKILIVNLDIVVQHTVQEVQVKLQENV
jgi:ribosomal protein L3